MSDTSPAAGFSAQMQQVMQEQQANELETYKFGAQQSEFQTMMQTYGGLAMDASKAKPQV